MVLASRSTTMRRAGAFLALVAFEIGAVVILHRLGELPWLRVPFDDLGDWLRTSAPEDVLAGVVRLVALGAAWWLLGSTALYALARISRVPSAIRALELVTLPSVRRIADQAIALTLATSIVSGGAGAALADPAGVPTRPESVVVSHDPLATWARTSTLGYRPTPGTTDPPSYRPEAAGPAATATSPGSGQPAGGTSAAATGVDQATAEAAPAYRPEAAGPSTGQPATSAPAGTEAGVSPATTAAAPAYQPKAAGSSAGQAEPGYRPEAAGSGGAATPGATTTYSSSSSSTTSSTQPPMTTSAPSTTSPPTTTTRPTTTSPLSSSTSTTGPATTKPPASPRYIPRAAGSTPSSTRPPTPSTPRYTPNPAGQPPAPLPEAPPGKGEAALHHVAEGDNLWTIARDRLAKVRGRPAGELSEREIARYWLDVVDANRASLRSGDPDLIFPGEIIKLPPVTRHER